MSNRMVEVAKIHHVDEIVGEYNVFIERHEIGQAKKPRTCLICGDTGLTRDFLAYTMSDDLLGSEVKRKPLRIVNACHNGRCDQELEARLVDFTSRLPDTVTLDAQWDNLEQYSVFSMFPPHTR